MKNFKQKLWLKADGIVILIAVVLATTSHLLNIQNNISDFMFLIGMALICLTIINILLHAGLLAGWFRKKQKGETDEEYQERKIDVRNIASKKKNAPIHFESFAANCLILGIVLIVLAIAVTL